MNIHFPTKQVLLLLALGTAALISEPAWAGEGLVIESEDGQQGLKIQGRIQGRLATEIVPDTDPEAAFSIPRARLKLSGHHFGDTVHSKLQIDFGKGALSLKDAIIEWHATKGLRLATGQFKKPFSRQELTSSGSQGFVDRAITAKGFGAGRDIGLMLHNGFSKSPTVEWAVGLFNGTGDKAHFAGSGTADATTGEVSVEKGKFTNVPALFRPTLALRVGYNHGKLKGYSEADLEGGSLRFGVAASLLSDVGSPDGSFSHRQELDFILKVSGFSLSGAFYNAMAASGTVFKSLAPAALGAHLQAGYVFGGQVHAGLRWALVDPDGDANSTQELLLVLSDFVHGHHLKIQLDGGALLHAGGDADLLVRLQGQLAF